MAREAMDICLRVLKERNKSRFDSCSDHIPYYLSGLSPAHFSDNLSRNSYIRQLVKSPPPPFHIPEAWKSYPFGRSLPVKAIIGSTPPGDFHYLKEKLHVYTINDIQLLKMYQLQIAGRTRTSETGGLRIQKFFNRKKAWARNFFDS